MPKNRNRVPENWIAAFAEGFSLRLGHEHSAGDWLQRSAGMVRSRFDGPCEYASTELPVLPTTLPWRRVLLPFRAGRLFANSRW